MFDKLGLIMVVVSDMDRSVSFYRDILGLKFEFMSPDWSQFDIGGVGFGLHIASPHLPVNAEGGVSFGFYVPDLDAVLHTLEERGITPTQLKDEDFGRLAIINDPDGYGIQICQSKYSN